MKSFAPAPDCSSGIRGECSPQNTKGLRTLEAIVQHYIDSRRDEAKRELQYFGRQANLAKAIRVAALAINAKGKRHSHQRRIPGLLLEHYRRGLMRKRTSLLACKRFDDLMEISQSIANKIWKHSELTVYDTAHRIGSYLKLHPDRVYLHAGTRTGAKALGVKRSVPYVFRRMLPPAFQRLKPYEIEDCLCTYIGALKTLAQGGRSNSERD